MSEKQYFNRELSWLEFNHRVLEEACDNNNPLLERLKYAAIVSSNLDEFFMVRVASIRDKIHAGFTKKDISGLLPKDEMLKISQRAHRMTDELYKCYNNSLKRRLSKEKIYLAEIKDLNPEQLAYIDSYYESTVFPVLTPMVVDSSRPFPLILNKSLNISLLLTKQNDKKNLMFATVQVPSVLPRIIEIPPGKSKRTFVFLEDIIKEKLTTLFAGHKVLTTACYRITRNADLSLDEEGAEDLLSAIEQSLRQRKWGSVIRLEIEKDTDPDIQLRLISELEVETEDIYMIHGPIDLNFLNTFYPLEGFDCLRYLPKDPVIPRFFSDFANVFDAVSHHDILLHHPYHSFQPVIDFVRHAAFDPQVLAIKQTLYRVSGTSPIVEALVQAAENGKQVTVLVELKARFDEEKNIQWAKRLETAGCHVIYGFPGLKTHCKILLVVRQENEGIKRYVHLSTGNYNDITARFYTDIGLFTASPYFGADVSSLFNRLSGLSQPMDMYRLTLAPDNLRQKLLGMIRREITLANEGKKAKIIIKVNSLVDQEMIDALYDASKTGVSVELIVRGVCCLKPGIPELSVNISVSSIVDRFLEHSRIYYFYNDGDEDVFLSSADLMERNLDRRIELLFPIDDPLIKHKVIDILTVTLNDNDNTRRLNPDGNYVFRRKKGRKTVNSQQQFYQTATKDK